MLAFRTLCGAAAAAGLVALAAITDSLYLPLETHRRLDLPARAPAETSREMARAEMSSTSADLMKAAGLVGHESSITGAMHNIKKGNLKEKPGYEAMFMDVKIMPKARVFVCGVAKVGLTTWERVATIVNGKQFRSGGRTPWFSNSPEVYNVSFQDYLGLLHNKTWRGVVTYRDPIERFLSAYASKCELKDPDGRKHCHYRFNLSHPTIEMVADRLSVSGYSDHHWVPQSHFCGGTISTKWALYTDHVPIHNLSLGILDIFSGRIPHNTLRKIEEELSHLDGGHMTHSERRSTSLTPAVRSKLVDFYWADYRLFRINDVSV